MKPIQETLRLFVPAILFLIFTIYLMASDANIVGPY